MRTPQIIQLPKFLDERGNLSFFENDNQLPFAIQRVHWIYDVPGGESRGGYAHKELQQLILTASGSFYVTLDDGKVRCTFNLNRPYQGLLVKPGIWRTLDDFSSGSVCLVLASEKYDADDYLREYEEFIKNKKNYNMKAPIIIAEIGCNHKGDMAIAKEMIQTAALYCKADVVKFQKRCNRELLTPEEYNAPHPHPENSYGPTYGAHREFLEFSLEQHRQLKAWCEEFEIVYSTSVWDLTSAKEIASLKPKLIKIPSACNLNKEMLGWLCDNYEGEIHLSFGMTTKVEEEEIVSFFEQKDRNKDLVLYNCTSGYPVPFEDICLLELTRMREQYAHRVKAIGFSGHHLGIAVDSAAVALGAEYIERHYTLDRTWKGTDHAASLEPDGVRKLARDCRAVAKALTYKQAEVLPIEQVQRDKLKKNQIKW